ncbi:MAG: [FeFe] hydrogenase H-cluster radical SAM maturase HydE [Calditrichia bacterium]|nr:[FeFe] hydrogenase H-cluster radical SAM maturase HydE [Calditrichia bacterium]
MIKNNIDIFNKFLENKYPDLDKEFLAEILQTKDDESIKKLRLAAQHVRENNVGSSVYYRGLIEISNYCMKNCYYCGLRKDNKKTTRYTMDFKDVKKAIKLAYTSKMGSLVIQSGELLTPKFYDYIGKVLKHIQKEYDDQLRVTLSLGELPKEVLKEYYGLGAKRYLLRIESSDKELYYKLHPEDDIHSYDVRLKCLENLRELDYHVGTGVMIGLPYQTYENLANDLLFMKNIDIDMVGMGPYIEHAETPLAHINEDFFDRKERIELSYRMIALLRLLMPDINIASTTALQTLDPLGREKGVACGANVVMPNLSDEKYRDKYFLYDGKPCVDDKPDHCVGCLAARVKAFKYEVAYGEFGDSLHYLKRQNK